MCAEHGQYIHTCTMVPLGIPCIECEMAKCSRERGTWNWPFYLPHLDLDLHSVPPMLLLLEFVGDSPFSVYSPALQPFDTRKHLRQRSTARQKADVSTNFQRAQRSPAGVAARDGLFCTIADRRWPHNSIVRAPIKCSSGLIYPTIFDNRQLATMPASFKPCRVRLFACMVLLLSFNYCFVLRRRIRRRIRFVLRRRIRRRIRRSR